MALKDQPTGRLLPRVAAVTGLFILALGAGLWLALDMWAGIAVSAAGLLIAVIGFVFEVPNMAEGLRSRRATIGGSVAAQILLAALLLVLVNTFAFLHYTRFDLTRDRAFTLDKKFRDQLAKLNRDTTVVIFQRHTAFGQNPENPPDNYDAAAERKIVEKVRDLAELFQDFGPRFRVEVLDIHEDSFEDKLNRFKQDMPKLADAIGKAKENAIFFYATIEDPTASPSSDIKKDPGYVQMLGFNDIFELDKKASYAGSGGLRNLVLRDQGVDAFVNKILNIQEKRPKVAFAVAHEYLGVEGDPLLWGMGGVKKAFQSRGIDHLDIVLKKFGRFGPPTATVLTHEESQYERNEAVIVNLEKEVEELNKTIDVYTPLEKDFREMSLEELNNKYFFLVRPGGRVDVFSEPELEGYRKDKGWVEGRDYRRIPTLRITQDYRLEYLEDRVAPILRESRQIKEIKQKNLNQARAEIKEVNVERLSEQKRITDLRGKLDRLLADVDLLVVPRLTLLDALRNEPLEYELHKLEEPQVAAVKAFMKAGKPVLFLMDPPFTGPNITDEKGDDIDQMLRELGVIMPAQTILYDVETESLVQGKGSGLRIGRIADVPPVEFDRVDLARPRGMRAEKAGIKLHPIRGSLLIAGHSVSKDVPGDLRLRNPRPIYYLKYRTEAVAALLGSGFAALPTAGIQMASNILPDALKTLDENAVILTSGKGGWNTEKPFAEDEIPRYTTPSAENPDVGTWKEPRRGVFPIGIAVERTAPSDWYSFGEGRPATTRFSVIGDAEVFKGENLTPMKERLLLDVSNWLMGRDDLLTRDTGRPWTFLRSGMTETTKNLWSWAMWLGLPLCFIYIGTLVMLVRRTR